MKTANAANVAFDAFELDLLHEAVCAQLERLAGLQAELAGWDAPGDPLAALRARTAQFRALSRKLCEAMPDDPV